ncbi:MAG TPA: site-specific integrase [Solirubrobacteraceae bacterium]|jgi:hypothetical protein
MASAAKRSYGSGRLFVRADPGGRETWYGSWRVGGRRVKRRVGLKRRPSMADGLTRTQAEAELRRLIANTTVVGGAARRTLEEAGTAYIDHLEHVMKRKRKTIADYHGYLRKHLAPFFGGRPLDKIDRAGVESYLLAKKRDGLSAKTIQNHLSFLHGTSASRSSASGRPPTPLPWSTARRRRARRTAACASSRRKTSRRSSARCPTTTSATSSARSTCAPQ